MASVKADLEEIKATVTALVATVAEQVARVDALKKAFADRPATTQAPDPEGSMVIQASVGGEDNPDEPTP